MKSSSVTTVFIVVLTAGITHFVITGMPEQSRWLQLLGAVVASVVAAAIVLLVASRWPSK